MLPWVHLSFSVIYPERQACQSGFILLPVFLSQTLLSDSLYTAGLPYKPQVLGLLYSYYIEEDSDSQEYGIAQGLDFISDSPKVWCLLLLQEAPGTLLMGEKKKKGRWFALSFEHYFSRDRWAAIQRWTAFGLVPKVSGNILYSYPEKRP